MSVITDPDALDANSVATYEKSLAIIAQLLKKHEKKDPGSRKSNMHRYILYIYYTIQQNTKYFVFLRITSAD